MENLVEILIKIAPVLGCEVLLFFILIQGVRSILKTSHRIRLVRSKVQRLADDQHMARLTFYEHVIIASIFAIVACYSITRAFTTFERTSDAQREQRRSADHSPAAKS